MMWGLCADPAIVIDIAHWQGTDIPFLELRELGVEGVIAKRWHGRSDVKSGDIQIEAALAAGFDLHGEYSWLLPDADLDLQIGAWRSRPRRAGQVPLMIDFEHPDTKLRGRALVAKAEYVVEKVSDRIGCRPLFYTGEWYWQGYCANVDSPIIAECELVLAAYPRKSIAGTRYREAIAEVCGGVMPAVPLPWKSRGLEPIMWQLDGDLGLYLPNGVDTDVCSAFRARLRAMRYQPDPAGGLPTRPETPSSKSQPRMPAVKEPGLDLGDNGPPNDPYRVDRNEAALASLAEKFVCDEPNDGPKAT